jgi:hypothetical protein
MESSSINVVSIKPSLMGFRKWVNPSLGGTTNNHVNEWLRNQKQPNHFYGPFFVKCFHNYKLLFFHVYQLYVLINGLKFIWEF